MPILVAFDLEGPISTQDNAYEVMGLIPQGHELFARISKYDDTLALMGRLNYEPGDTLALIVPFLLANGIHEADIKAVSDKADLVPGAKECLDELQAKGFVVVIVSTSYCQHAHNVAEKLGFPKDRVACTKLPLDSFYERLTEDDKQFVLDVQTKALSTPAEDEEALQNLFSKFFWHDLPQRPIGKLLKEVRVVGGARKMTALSRFAVQFGIEPQDCVVIGDSITDFKMLAMMERGGALAIVFNGNEYAVPYGTVGVAAMDLRAVLPLIYAFAEGGRFKVEELVEQNRRQKKKPEDAPVLHWLAGMWDFDEPLEVHKKFRSALRGKAAQLG